MRMGQSYEPKIYITSGLLVALVNYPVLTNGASPPRGEDFLLLPGNLLYTPSEKGLYSRGFLSTGSKGSPDPARRIFREAFLGSTFTTLLPALSAL